MPLLHRVQHLHTHSAVCDVCAVTSPAVDAMTDREALPQLFQYGWKLVPTRTGPGLYTAYCPRCVALT